MRFPLAQASLGRMALPLLARLDPERAHRLALHGLALGTRLGLRGAADDAAPELAQDVLGRRFANPLGLAAGFDKDARALRPLLGLGFGFLEAGTVTPLPQPGNPRPRLFRLAEDGAAINRMGFNGAGLAAFLRRRRQAGVLPAPLGINIGLNKTASDPLRDYPAMVGAIGDAADYIALNVSSPNTPGLRDLQAAGRLGDILAAIDAAVPVHPPLLVKIAPDLSEHAVQAVVETAIAAGIAGLIIGNTSLGRPASLGSRHRAEAGGLSGAPIFAASTALLARAALMARGKLLLIGCGGVASGADAWAKLCAGASLVQLYTAFAYQGPALLPRLLGDLARLMRDAGFTRLCDAIGSDAARMAEAPCSI